MSLTGQLLTYAMPHSQQNSNVSMLSMYLQISSFLLCSSNTMQGIFTFHSLSLMPSVVMESA